MENPYEAVDSGGNTLSLECWVAEKTLKNNTKIITELSAGNITSFTEVMVRAPVLAFHHEMKIRRMIRMRNNELVRRREWTGFRHIPLQPNQWNEATYAVYQRIIFFWNHRLVQSCTEKELTGLYLFSDECSIGKSAFLNCISELGHTYKHSLADNG